MTSTSRPDTRFHRDRLTFSLYGAFIVWGWFLYAFSPTVPLIAEEMDISRGLAGLHGTAIAVGTITAGLLTPVLARRVGRRFQYLVGSALLVVGMVLMVAGTVLAATLPAVLLLSLGGNLTITAAQPALMVHHGASGASAVTEANAAGAGVGLLAPLAVGASVDLGWGWRPAVAVTALLAVAAAVAVATLRHEPSLTRPEPVHHDGPAPARVPYPRAIWFFLAALVCGTAVEFSTIFWAPDLLTEQTGASSSLSTAAVSALVLGMTLCRLVVGPMAARRAPEKLLLAGFVGAFGGWLVFWLASSPAVAVAGLFVAGLGYGTHYPLAIALVLRSSGGRPDAAQGLSALAAGAAVGLAPYALGAVADVIGPYRAFVLVGCLAVAGAVLVALGLREVRRDPVAAGVVVPVVG